MRDRLIELIGDCKWWGSLEEMADYLLANGVIVPPCKVDTVVYYISVSIEPNDRGKWVTRKRIKAEKFHYAMLDWIDTPLYLTKEEAEEALKGGAE